MVSFLARAITLATLVTLPQLSVQVQTSASSQNVTLETDVTGINHSINAISNCQSPCSPGLHYIATPKTPFIGYTQGQYFIMTVDQSTQTNAVLDIGAIGPVILNGTCNGICLIMYYQPVTGSAQWSVH